MGLDHRGPHKEGLGFMSLVFRIRLLFKLRGSSGPYKGHPVTAGVL